MPSKLTWTNFWRRNQAATLGDLRDATQQILDGVQAAANSAAAKILAQLQQNQIKIMASLDETLADVQAESALEDSLIALVTGIKKQLDDALSGVSIPTAVQAKVNAIFDAVEANKKKVADAVASNTPVTPPVETPLVTTPPADVPPVETPSETPA